MKTTGNVPDFDNLSDLGLLNIGTVHWNLSPDILSEITIKNEMGRYLLQELFQYKLENSLEDLQKIDLL